MRIPVLLFVALYLGLLLGGPLGPASARAQPTIAADSVGRVLAEGQPGGGVIGLLHDDTTSVHAFGVVDSTGASPTAHTVFEIGSITKTVTGLLLAERIEQGRLRPTTPVPQLLPDSVSLARADTVGDATMTLAHLAMHRSGLPRLPSNLEAGASPWDPYAAYGDRALYAFLDDYTLPRAPGKTYEYSNLGMGLLGALLARRADTTYAALVQQRIATPLGLSDTRIHLTDSQEERFAQGYTRAGLPASPWHFEALAGAGALRSTAADLLIYLRAHRAALHADADTSSILTQAMQRALRPRATIDSENTRIGFAWHEVRRDGHRIVVHTGGTGGFRSFVGLDRATGHGAVVLVNASRSSDRVTEAGLHLIEALRAD